MKKCGMIVMLFSLFLLAGCGNGNKVTCTGNMRQGSGTTKVKVVGEFKNDKLAKTTTTTTFEESKDAESYCNMMTEHNKNAKEGEQKFDFKCSGSKVTVTTVPDSEESMTKEVFTETMENQALACK